MQVILQMKRKEYRAVNKFDFKVFNTRRPRAPLLCLYVCLSVCLSARHNCGQRITKTRMKKTKFGPTYCVHLQLNINININININMSVYLISRITALGLSVRIVAR